MSFMAEASAILGFIALLATLFLTISNVRARLREPEDARWKEMEKWKDEVNKRCIECSKWRGRTDRSIERSNTTFRAISKLFEQRNEFERLILMSTRTLLEFIPTDSSEAARARDKITQDIDSFLMALAKSHVGNLKSKMSNNHSEDTEDPYSGSFQL